MVAGISWAKHEVDPHLYQIRRVLVKDANPTKKRLLWFSKKARENLVNLATDRKESKLVRTRAILALRYFATPGTFRVLRTMTFDPNEPAAVRGAAMDVLGVFSDPGVVGILKQFVLSGNPVFRLNAARGLARNGSPEACAAIQQALVRERDLDIKMKLDHLSQVCGKQKGGGK